MSPDQINIEHGRPSWTCWKCKADRGLTWWNGLSVAVCTKTPECGKAYSEFLSEEIAKEEAFQQYVRENAPW